MCLCVCVCVSVLQLHHKPEPPSVCGREEKKSLQPAPTNKQAAVREEKSEAKNWAEEKPLLIISSLKREPRLPCLGKVQPFSAKYAGIHSPQEKNMAVLCSMRSHHGKYLKIGKYAL